MSEVVALFPDGAPRRGPLDAPETFDVGQRVRCAVTGRTGTVIMVRDQCVFTVRLDAGPPRPGPVVLPGDVVRVAASIRRLDPLEDPQVIAYVRGRRAGETTGPEHAWCLVRDAAGVRWEREWQR